MVLNPLLASTHFYDSISIAQHADDLGPDLVQPRQLLRHGDIATPHPDDLKVPIASPDLLKVAALRQIHTANGLD